MANWKQQYFVTPKNRTREVKIRKCLRCSDDFNSLNWGHRFCQACRMFIKNGKGIPRGKFFFGEIVMEDVEK